MMHRNRLFKVVQVMQTNPMKLTLPNPRRKLTVKAARVRQWKSSPLWRFHPPMICFATKTQSILLENLPMPVSEELESLSRRTVLHAWFGSSEGAGLSIFGSAYDYQRFPWWLMDVHGAALQKMPVPSSSGAAIINHLCLGLPRP